MPIGFYACARRDRYPNYDIVYNDISSRFLTKLHDEKKLIGDLRNVDPYYIRTNFDYFIATPPCNYYSRANYRRNTSNVALSTKDLLPRVLQIACIIQKPFIIENVLNDTLLPHDYDKYCRIIKFGGHCFWTNVAFDYDDLVPIKQNKSNVCRSKRDGNYNVHCIIERFLQTIHNKNGFLLLRCHLECL